MSTLKIYDMKGASVGEMEVAGSCMVLDRGDQAVKDAVTAYRNSLRAGTASTLSKGEVAGSNRKPWRQKGTGQARAGFRQSPIWRGGGVAFGPKPRSFAQKVNRKVARLAFQRALSDRLNDGAVKVVDSLDLQAPRTKEMTGVLKALGVRTPALIVTDEVSPALGLACRNIRGLELVKSGEVNVYQLLRYPTVLATRAAMEALNARMAAGSAAEKAV
jgi:large subunit ribosomal protein L4